MKLIKRLGLLAAVVTPLLTTQAETPAVAPAPSDASTPPVAPVQPPAVSPAVAEVVRLAESGTTEEVMLSYIQNSSAPYELSADQILYLRDIGLSSAVITAMLNRDNVMRGQASPPGGVQPPLAAAAPPATAPPVALPTTAQPAEAPPSPTPGAVTAPLVPPEGAAQPVYVSSPPPEVNYFYSNLSPYGSWVQLAGVGWCWQPRVVVVNHAWRPYCDSGHWVYTDAGWFWQSDYSWGWAAFHYGRWHLHERCGWVWLPDRVWGPAWVTWRYEGDHCGWAPLPPHADFDSHYGYRYNGVHVAVTFDFGLHPEHFTFIAIHDFHEHDFAHYRLPPREVTKIYNHTTVINNYVINNNTVVNQGIQVDRVSAATHTQFKKVAIRDVPAGSSTVTTLRPSDKGSPVVYRQQPTAPAKPVNMVAQKVDDRHPMIQHTPVTPAPPQRPAIAANTKPSSSGSWPRPATDRAPAYPEAKPSPAYHSETTRQPTTTSASPSQPPPARGQYPLQSGTASQSDSSPNSQQGSQVYHPKGYYQGSDSRTGNAHSADSRSHQPSNSGKGNDNGNKNSNGQSKKNEQY